VTSKSERLQIQISQWVLRAIRALILDSQSSCLDHSGLDEILAAGVCGWSGVDNTRLVILLSATNAAQHGNNFLEGLLKEE
jgi:hypothetical protein